MPDDVSFRRATQYSGYEEPRVAPARRDLEEEMPRVAITRKRALIFGLFVVGVAAFLYFVLPRLAGLGETWDRIKEGDPAWLAACLVFETLSFLGYVWLFRTVFVRGDGRISWAASYEITMAGVVATRLFAAAGAGGIALTAWALRRSGMERRLVACRMVAFLGLLYFVYMASLLVVGLGLGVGIFSGDAPTVVTIVPAVVGGLVIALGAVAALLPQDMERRLKAYGQGHGRFARLMGKLAAVPASAAAGLRSAIAILRGREPGVLGGVLWWYFDIATLWAAFHAFGEAPPFAVIVMAYFVGMLANMLPIPGGVGGVDGGMIGTFIAFGVDSGLAVVAVLVYRGFSFWLPIIPGAVAYVQLRKRVASWRTQQLA